MHFTEIRLTNFGQYNGEHVLDLRSNTTDEDTNDRPVVLIGGRNGAGKTTILEAVKLCLYGSATLGIGVRQQAYEEYLVGRIHRQLGAPLNNMFAGVGLGFVHTIGGITQTFDVRRMWQRQRRGVEEILEVRRDGAPLEAHEYSWWEQFLHELLPPGLANLFFFDGEKIQALADDSDHVALRSSIQALLGLDLLHHLRDDLAVYVSRQKRSGDLGLEQQLAALAHQRAEVEEGFDKAYTQSNAIAREISHRKGRIEYEERLLASEGGTIVERRDGLKRRSEMLHADLRRYERAVAEQASGLLPFAVIPALNTSLRSRLIIEEQAEQQRALRALADTFSQELISRIQHDNKWLNGVNVGVHNRPYVEIGLADTIREVAQQIAGSGAGADDQELLHDLSKNERRTIIGWLDQASTTVPQTLQELGIAIEATTNELAQIETTLQQLPADETIQPILQRLAALQREVGALEEQHKQHEAEVQQWRSKRAELARKEQELYARMMRGDDPGQRLTLASRARQALAKYEDALQRAKIQELEQKIVECFARLSRKGNYIRKVSIDPQTFEAMLFNHKGDALPKQQLSAGEKQIYAVALLWALRLVARRSLPIIVDTPLGRLDSEHRQRLVERYFPQASHQVILLSTDTEVDDQLYQALLPAISHSYRLVYQPVEASSRIEDGYFDEAVELSQ